MNKITKIEICPNSDNLALRAAQIFVKNFKIAMQRSGRMSVALSGGNTPLDAYTKLATEPLRSEVDWSRVHIFWGDERCVSVSDSKSNFHEAQTHLLSKVPILKEQIHPMFLGGSPEISANEYERVLRHHFKNSAPVFDLIFLGLGQDGHTASLFPNSLTLDEKIKWVSATKKPGEEFSRMTLNLTILNQARFITFLVSGKEKAPVLSQILQKASLAESYPASRIDPACGELLWLVDSSAYRG